MRKRKRKYSPPAGGAVIILAVVIGAGAAGAAALLPLAKPILKNVAVVSVMAARPEQSMELLEKRFYSQLYPPREEEPAKPSPAPQPDLPKET